MGHMGNYGNGIEPEFQLNFLMSQKRGALNVRLGEIFLLFQNGLLVIRVFAHYLEINTVLLPLQR
jgi:hypothetical protein